MDRSPPLHEPRPACQGRSPPDRVKTDETVLSTGVTAQPQDGITKWPSIIESGQGKIPIGGQISFSSADSS